MAGASVRTASKVAFVSLTWVVMVSFPSLRTLSAAVDEAATAPFGLRSLARACRRLTVVAVRVHVVAQQAPAGAAGSLVQHRPVSSSADGSGSSASTV